MDLAGLLFGSYDVAATVVRYCHGFVPLFCLLCAANGIVNVRVRVSAVFPMDRYFISFCGVGICFRLLSFFASRAAGVPDVSIAADRCCVLACENFRRTYFVPCRQRLERRFRAGQFTMVIKEEINGRLRQAFVRRMRARLIAADACEDERIRPGLVIFFVRVGRDPQDMVREAYRRANGQRDGVVLQYRRTPPFVIFRSNCAFQDRCIKGHARPSYQFMDPVGIRRRLTYNDFPDRFVVGIRRFLVIAIRGIRLSAFGSPLARLVGDLICLFTGQYPECPWGRVRVLLLIMYRRLFRVSFEGYFDRVPYFQPSIIGRRVFCFVFENGVGMVFVDVIVSATFGIGTHRGRYIMPIPYGLSKACP